MPFSVIKINGGADGQSDDTITLGSTVTLTSGNDSGATSWKWELIYKPPTSSAVLSGASTNTATFTADAEGSYLIQLTINSYIRSRAITAVKTIDGIRYIASQEAAELGGWEETINDNIDLLINKIDDGYLDNIKLAEQVSAPDAIDDYGILYSFDIDGYSELHYVDNFGNLIQLTSKGSAA